MAIIRLHCVKIGKHQFSNFWSLRRELVEFLPRLGCNLTIVLHLAHWGSETNWNIAISMAGV